jgi:hypothetical protein
MRSTLPYLAIVFLLVWVTGTEGVAQSSGRKAIHAFVAADQQRKPRTRFSSDVPRIYACWKGQSLAVGDKIHAVWIAEDVGAASPKDTKIRDAEVQVFKTDESGEVFLSRPTGQDWPLGKYRVELYLNGSISEVVKFTIEPGVQIETH